MDLNTEVKDIQEDLADLKSRIDAFEAQSKATIKTDHQTMLVHFQKSIDSVGSTVQYLETGSSRLVGYIEYISNSRNAEAVGDLVRTHLNDMHTNFASLQSAAMFGLGHVEHIKKTYDDMHNELDSIRTKLQSLTTRTQASLHSAQNTLQERQRRVNDARSTLETTTEKLSELEAKMSKKKGVRNGMRVARVVTWGLVFLCPLLLAIAGVLEGAACAHRRARKKLQSEIDQANARYTARASELSAIESQAALLNTAVNEAHDLLYRSERIDAASREMGNLIRHRLEEYQALKTSADSFGAWTRDLFDQTSTARIISSSSLAMLHRTTKQIVDALRKTEQGDAKSVCRRLRRLEIREH